MNIGFPLWLASVAAVLAQAALGYSDMPARFASHFNAANQPNAWMGRGPFFAVWFGAIAMSNVSPILVRVIMRGMPASMINMPYKDYWFATPERQKHAMGVIESVLCWIMICVNIILFMAFRGVHSAALGGKFEFSLPVFITFFVASIVTAIVYPFVALRPPPEAR